MCLKKVSESPQTEAESPRSPWKRLLTKNSKPRLPRSVTRSTRVNLNKCWSKLGELITNTPPRTDLPSHKTAYPEEPVLVPFSKYFYPTDPVKPVTEDDDNAENENILNSSRFELISDAEIGDNMANEVREICYAATKSNCFVCKLCF